MKKIDPQELIKGKREEKGYSQTVMADLLGKQLKQSYSLRQYQRLENGDFPKYKQEVIRAVDEILGTNVYDIIYDINVPHNTVSEGNKLYVKHRNDLKNAGTKKKGIPFYDTEATAGMTEIEMSPIHAPAGTIDIGDLLSDSQAAIRIYGNSMLPNYPPGCVVGLLKIDSSVIEPGEVYVIETIDRRLLKRLFYKNDNPDEEFLTLYSDNIMKFEGGARDGKLAYPPSNIHKNDIKNLFLVTGVIKRNTNSVIINR